MGRTDPPIPTDPLQWTAMRPYRGRGRFEITNPVIEPLWSGVRTIAHIERNDRAAPASVKLIEELGADMAEELPDVVAALSHGVLASNAVVDGVVSSQVNLDGIGAAAVTEVKGSTTGFLMRNNAELTVVPRGLETDEDEDEDEDGFIAFDLLRVDGTSLLDVPLLERKRLLESVIDESQMLRASIHARPPIESWVTTWKALGLRGGILKAANSRYHPGGDSTEWRLVENVGRRR